MCEHASMAVSRLQPVCALQRCHCHCHCTRELHHVRPAESARMHTHLHFLELPAQFIDLSGLPGVLLLPKLQLAHQLTLPMHKHKWTAPSTLHPPPLLHCAGLHSPLQPLLHNTNTLPPLPPSLPPSPLPHTFQLWLKIVQIAIQSIIFHMHLLKGKAKCLVCLGVHTLCGTHCGPVVWSGTDQLSHVGLCISQFLILR